MTMAKSTALKNHLGLVSAAIVVLLLAAAALITFVTVSEPEAPAEADEAHVLGGVHFNPPRKAPEIAAVNYNDQSYTLSKQPHPLKMIFFGYVSCTDVCPTNLKKFEKMQEELGSELDQVQFVFVSIDPEKESPEVMKEYLSYYKGEIIGVTGTDEQLQPVYDAWGVRRDKVEVDPSVDPRGYKWDHTGQIYLVQGMNLRVSYPYGTPHQEMQKDIEALLRDPSIGERLPEISEVQEIVLPPGAYTKRFQKEPTIPTYIRLRVGDTLVYKNDDYMYHYVGDIRLAPGDTATQTFSQPGEFYLGCTATPDESIRIVVLEEDEEVDEDTNGPLGSL